MKKHSAKRALSAAVMLSLLTALSLPLTGCGWDVAPPGEAASSALPENAESSTPAVEVSGTESETTQIPEDGIIARASLMSTGDILLHSTFLGDGDNDGVMDDRNSSAYYDAKTDSYDFSPIFQYVKDYYTKADYAICNLEVTLCGDDKVDYGGYPLFNSPDSIADALSEAGIDCVLTATNHIADTDYFGGFERTQNAIEKAGLEFTGTQKKAGQKKYTLIEVNGIKIGIVNYVYTSFDENGQLCINGMPMGAELAGKINHFAYDHLDDLYAELKDVLQQMQADGAEAYVFYPHWGEEYQLQQNAYQDAMAENIAALGYTAIVGDHTHCIQPTAVVTGKDGQAVPVLFSMGNEVSNQRKELMDTLNDGHTEDSLLYYLNFAKRADGTVFVESTGAIPTWTHMYLDEQGRRTYEIVPLDKDADWTDFNLSEQDGSMADAQASYQRTAALVGNGIRTYNQLQAEKSEK